MVCEPDLSCSKHRQPQPGCETCRFIALEHKARTERDELLAAIDRCRRAGLQPGYPDSARSRMFNLADQIASGSTQSGGEQ